MESLELAPTVYVAHESACIEAGCSIGRGTRIGPFAHLLAGARVGEDCELGHGVVVAATARIGDRVSVADHVSVADGVVLEDRVCCAAGVAFRSPDRARGAAPPREAEGQVAGTRSESPGTLPAEASILVQEGASVGANAVVLGGASLGQWAMIAPGAMVAGKVVHHARYAGSPAQQVGWVCRCGKSLFNFFASSDYCRDCDQHYRIQPGFGLREFSPEAERAAQRELLRRVSANVARSLTPTGYKPTPPPSGR